MVSFYLDLELYMILSTEQVTKKYLSNLHCLYRRLGAWTFTWVPWSLETKEKYIHIHPFPFRRLFHPNLGTLPLIYWSRWGKASSVGENGRRTWDRWLTEVVGECQAERCREKGGTFRNVGEILANRSNIRHSTRDGGSTFRSTKRVLSHFLWKSRFGVCSFATNIHLFSPLEIRMTYTIIVFHTQNAFIKDPPL